MQWGLSSYVEEGFEAEVASLGAQKQVGLAIGLDRLLLALGGSSA